MKKKSRMAPSDGATLHYRIEPVLPKAHLFEITLEITHPDPQGQKLALPVWIPGSYLVREFSRHIVEIGAHESARKRPIELVKLDKNTWQAPPASGTLVVVYKVYAWDLSVRAAHLDETHGFFNGTSVFLRVVGQEHLRHEVTLAPPPGKSYQGWRVATTLAELDAKRYGFGRYWAPSYDALVDHPVELGSFQLLSFKASGVPHELAITGRVPNLDVERVRRDVKAICEEQIRLFEPQTSAAPFQRYVFLLTVLGEGYGGLEHRDSTALICARDALPALNGRDPGDSYASFLGLVSHEYFHSWNVKRIKPQRFAPYDFDQENYTSLLWIFEGFTSYYDDLILVRTQLLPVERYLQTLAKTIAEVQNASGRLKQSVSESSFDAWIKYYRQDENSPNAIVSYYKKGSLIALGLDLTIRAASAGKRSLDDVMRHLWRRYGQDFYPQNVRGLGEDEFVQLVLDSTGVDVTREVRQWAYGTTDVPLEALFKPFGVAMNPGAPGNGGRGATKSTRPSLGARVTSEGGLARLATVSDGGPAQVAGLSAGDVLIALDGLRVSASNLDTLLERYSAGHAIDVHAFRRDELLEVRLLLGSPPLQWQLSAAPGRRRLRQAWLGQAPAANRQPSP
jgi:predicted metalloprotease with PDZ domain